MEKRVPLQVQKRDTGASVRSLRAEKLVPGVLYGYQVESTPFQVDYQTFRKTFEKASYSTIIDLDIEGKNIPVLVQDVEYHPVKDTYHHVDLLAINMNKPVFTTIPLEFIGDCELVRSGAAILATVKNELKITCLPNDLVHSIPVDISVLGEIGASIHVSDIQLPSGMSLDDEPEADLVVMLQEPREEEPETIEAAPAEGAEGAEAGAKEGEASEAEGKESSGEDKE